MADQVVQRITDRRHLPVDQRQTAVLPAHEIPRIEVAVQEYGPTGDQGVAVEELTQPVAAGQPELPRQIPGGLGEFGHHVDQLVP